MNDNCRQTLLHTARRSISHTLETGLEWLPDLPEYPSELQIEQAAFVTLSREGRLRGCIGTTEANDPLIVNTARYAHAAAFRDPRFPSVTRDEFNTIRISLSLLTPEQEMQFSDDTELLRQLTPGRDGLTIAYGHGRATFLPSVWESLPDPAEFLRQLKHKGGLPGDRPPQRAWCYQAITISETDQ